MKMRRAVEIVPMSESLRTHKHRDFLFKLKLQKSPDPALIPGHVPKTGHSFSLVLASCSTVRVMAVAEQPVCARYHGLFVPPLRGSMWGFLACKIC